MSGRWDVTLSFSLLCRLVVQYPAVRQRDGNSRTSIMHCWRYKLKRKSEISEEELFIGPQTTLIFKLLNSLKKSSLTEVNQLLQFTTPLTNALNRLGSS